MKIGAQKSEKPKFWINWLRRDRTGLKGGFFCGRFAFKLGMFHLDKSLKVPGITEKKRLEGT